ncbi:MAG: alpha-amylase family glycosyl hydrolase, partial [Planctomycetota bacterium]
MRCVSRMAAVAAAYFAALAAPQARAQLSRPPQDEVIYQIMPIAWRDSNNDAVNGVQARFGDFGGLAATESLDYLQYLGVTMVYLQPIFPSPAYHGYQHGPGNTLNPNFGTEAQFLAFVNAAHARGIKVILDFVAYGISHTSTWYQSASNNPASVYDGWLAFTNAANTTYVGSVYGTWNGSQVGFIHWDLTNAAAVNTVIGHARNLLDPNGDGDTSDGVDGFRLDHAWASGGEGWGANIAFWQTSCSAMRAAKPGVFIFCEPSDWGNYGTDLLQPNAFNAVITKPWQFASRDAVNLRNASGLYSSMAATYAAVPAGKLVVAQMSDHDSDRLASVLANSAARQKVAAAIQFTQPFPPNIYYGDELGMRGTKAATGT